MEDNFLSEYNGGVFFVTIVGRKFKMSRSKWLSLSDNKGLETGKIVWDECEIDSIHVIL